MKTCEEDQRFRANILKEIRESKKQVEQDNEENELIEKADPLKVKKITKDQVDLLGSEMLYHRINRNLMELKFEAFFAKEQFRLFMWRMQFWYDKFGLPSFIAPYQIAMNFESLTALVCSTDRNPTHIRANITLSHCARVRFDAEWTLEPRTLKQHGLTFGDIAHMIVAKHRLGAPSLVETAMKTVLLHQLPMHDIPKELQLKATQGLYGPQDSIPDNLSLVGRNLFGQLKSSWYSQKGVGKK